MQASLAIYEALIQANVPAEAARRVAESLEQDMTSTLATKQDLEQLGLATRLDMDGLRKEFAGLRKEFEQLEQRLDLKLVAMEHRLEHRIVTKLGLLMTGLFGLAGTILALLR